LLASTERLSTDQKFGNFKAMKASSKNIEIADYYFGLLSNLNADSKLELITRLSDSLKSKSPSKSDDDSSLNTLYGAFKTSASAEHMISELRESRTFNRAIEDL